jgi:hypothetical protein
MGFNDAAGACSDIAQSSRDGWRSHLWLSRASAIRASIATDFGPNFRMTLPRCIFTVTSLIDSHRRTSSAWALSNVCSLRTRGRYVNATYSSTSPQRGRKKGRFSRTHVPGCDALCNVALRLKAKFEEVHFWPRKAAIPTSVASGEGL